MRLVQQGITTYPIPVWMALTSDHVTGATGKTLTVTISKNGGAFGAYSGTVTERASGWYTLNIAAGDVDTLGALVLHIEAAACDPTDVHYVVVAFNPYDAAALGLSRLDAAVSTRLASASYSAAPSVGAIADAVWDETAADHNTAGTMGNKLNAAGSASDPLLNNKDDYPDPDTIGNVLATLGLRPANYIGSVNTATGELALRVGDAYSGDTPHGRVRISHSIAGFDLTDADVTDIRLIIKQAAEKDNAAAAAIINVTAHAGSLAADEAEFELSSTDTGKLTAGGKYVWFASCLVSSLPFTWGEGTAPVLAKGRP